MDRMADVQRATEPRPACFDVQGATLPERAPQDGRALTLETEMGQGSTDMLPEAARSSGADVQLDRHAVAMMLSTFLVVFGAAVLYQGAATPHGFRAYFAGGVACLVAAAALAAFARVELRRSLRPRRREDDVSA